MDERLRIEGLHTASGQEHMERESRLLAAMDQALRQGRLDAAEATPLLRLYQWNTPTVSLGRSQTPDKALAPRWETWRNGHDAHGPQALVIRPTGGRAVWHEDELTYAVLIPLQHPLFQDCSPEERLGRWLLEGSRRAGVRDLSLERGGGHRDPLGLGAAPCFSSTSRHELRWKGLKWVGSARRLTSHAVLQHGAIRLGPGGDRLESWLSGTAVQDPRPWWELPTAAALAQSLEETFREMIMP